MLKKLHIQVEIGGDNCWDFFFGFLCCNTASALGKLLQNALSFLAAEVAEKQGDGAQKLEYPGHKRRQSDKPPSRVFPGYHTRVVGAEARPYKQHSREICDRQGCNLMNVVHYKIVGTFVSLPGLPFHSLISRSLQALLFIAPKALCKKVMLTTNTIFIVSDTPGKKYAMGRVNIAGKILAGKYIMAASRLMFLMRSVIRAST